MSIQEKFHAYPWIFYIVIAVITATIVACAVGILCNCFWEIIKTRFLNFWYWICPCLETVAHPDSPIDTVVERRIAGLEREQAQRLIDFAEVQADIQTALETGLEDNRVSNARLNARSNARLNARSNARLDAILVVALAATSTPNLSGIIIHPFPMEESRLPVAGDRASREAQPSNSTVPACVTLFLPSRTPIRVWAWVMDFLQRLGATWYRWRGSIVIQTFLSIDSRVLAEIGELVKKCCSVENGFTLQIASWAIFYHNFDSVHLIMLKEGDVPVNIEARWNKKRTGITMRGLNLNGAQIKATTENTSTTLRSSGPPSKGRRDLDKLHFPTEGFQGVEESLIHAAKAVEFDGISLVVRSEASYVVPPNSFLKETVHDELRKIPPLAMKMMKSILGSMPNLKTKQQLLAEYWKGVLQMEMIDCRNKVIIEFQNLPASEIVASTSGHSLRFNSTCPSSKDSEYWQRALHDLSEDNLSNGKDSLSSTVHSTRGRIKFILGEFESALLDFDLAVNSNTEGLLSTLLDRAMVKSVLARYPEAMQDLSTAAEINPNSNDIKKFQTCIGEILYQKFEEFWMDSSMSSTQTPYEMRTVQPIYDLLTGDDWDILGSHDAFSLDSPWGRTYQSLQSLLEMEEIPGLVDKRHWTEVLELSNLFVDLHEFDLEQGKSDMLDYLNLSGLSGYGSVSIGPKIAEGGQAEIFEALGTSPRRIERELVVKVFKQPFPWLALLQPDVLQFGGLFLDHPSPAICTALGVNFLDDGRCAFVFPRHWGDLRRLIDLQDECSPFDFHTSVRLILQIAEGMRSLHTRNILHRDLKASNILVNTVNPAQEDFRCMVADFECSVGVMGTGFWRAPEILLELKHRTSEPKLPWSKETDVYSFGMTCFEILTGRIPFDDLGASNVDVVLSGGRPLLPRYLDSELTTLIERCWHTDPKQRPSFSEICKALMLKVLSQNL